SANLRIALAFGSFGVGVLSLLRLILEVFTVGRSVPPYYARIISAYLLFGVAAITMGSILSVRLRCSAPVALVVLGVMTLPSTVVLREFVPILVRGLGVNGQDSLDVIIASRALFCGVELMAFPAAIWILLFRPQSED